MNNKEKYWLVKASQQNDWLKARKREIRDEGLPAGKTYHGVSHEGAFPGLKKPPPSWSPGYPGLIGHSVGSMPKVRRSPQSPVDKADHRKVPSPEWDTGVRHHSIFDAMAKKKLK